MVTINLVMVVKFLFPAPMRLSLTTGHVLLAMMEGGYVGMTTQKLVSVNHKPVEDVSLIVIYGLFTVSVNVSVYDDANKWIQLASVEIFTFNDAKHQRKKTLILTLTMNRP